MSELVFLLSLQQAYMHCELYGLAMEPQDPNFKIGRHMAALNNAQGWVLERN